jgi:hypothetical protein
MIFQEARNLKLKEKNFFKTILIMPEKQTD